MYIPLLLGSCWSFAVCCLSLAKSECAAVYATLEMLLMFIVDNSILDEDNIERRPLMLLLLWL